MKSATADDFGKLILRLALGGLILMHGLGKLTGDISFIGRMLQGVGLPVWLAYGVYLGEVLAPLLLIIGWYSRVGALLVAANMAFAIALVHRGDIFSLTRSGGWALELQALFLLTAVALALTGPGRISVNRR